MKKAFIFSLLVSFGASAADLVCDIKETTSSKNITYKLKASVKDSDKNPQISKAARLVLGVKIDIFSCPSCSVRNGQKLSEISTTLSSSNTKSVLEVLADYSIGSIETAQGTVGAVCEIIK